MKKSNRIILYIVAFVAMATSVASVVSLGRPAHAFTNEASIGEKWTRIMVYEALQSGNNAQTINVSEQMGTVADAIFPNDTTGYVWAPSMEIMKDIGVNQITGHAAIEYNTFGGDKKWSDNKSAAIDLIKSIGYEEVEGSSAEFNFTLEVTDEKGVTTPLQYGFVSTKDSNGNLSYDISDNMDIDANKNSLISISVNDNVLEATIKPDSDSCSVRFGNSSTRSVSMPLSTTSMSQAKSDFQVFVGQVNGLNYSCGGASAKITNYNETHATEYRYAQDGLLKFMDNYGGPWALDENERFQLYYKYFTELLKQNGGGIVASCGEEFNTADGGRPVNLLYKGQWTRYYIDTGGLDMSRRLNVPSDDGLSINSIMVEDMIGWFNSHAVQAELSEEECELPEAIEKLTTEASEAREAYREQDFDDKPCFNGAGALGWIVCPVIKFLRWTLETIYEHIIEPFLQINAKAFSNENGGVVAGWQAFQGFANLAFVALLLVVIFSQVTGVGIDNLGIKRILPKLIVAAILINLSYIICQLLVDASNIAGYGLRSLFDGIQVGEAKIVGTGQTVMNTALTAAVSGMTAAAFYGSVGVWGPAVILPLLLALIGMLISTLFMFILLGVRQAGVIILVVISPLAFAMYMLPNTKPLFQRWWKAFTGLLLLFPICGAMIGGADLAGKILASTSDEFWPNLIAALLTVVPFFFIPTLLKGSFSALGNLGAKISGVGAKIGARAGGIAKAGVERTGAFRNIQANAQERQDIRNRVAERKRLEGTTKRIGSIAESMRTPEQRMQYARAQAALEKMNDEDDFNSRPDLIVSEATAKRFNRQVEAVKSRNVASGAVNVTGDVKGFNGKGSSFASGSLAHILYNTQDEAERYATVSQLMASGHHGAEALHQVMEALGNDGNQGALDSIAKAAKGDNKLGDLKSGSRSTYDYINDLAAGKVQAGAVGSGNNISDYAGKVKFGGMSEQQLINTDKEELQRYAQVINQKRTSGESLTSEEQKLVQQATAAWDNERLRGSAKKDVQNLVSEIAFGAVNIGNNKARPGTSFDVQHNNSNSKSTPAPRTSTDRVNAATDRLEEIARQRNNGGGA